MIDAQSSDAKARFQQRGVRGARGPRNRVAGFWTVAGVAASLLLVWWAILHAVDAGDLLGPQHDSGDESEATRSIERRDRLGTVRPFDRASTRKDRLRSVHHRSPTMTAASKAVPGAGGNMPGSRLTIDIQDRKSQTVLVLVGDLDAHTAGDLEAALAGLEAAETPVALDMAGLEFIDSAGLGIIIRQDQQRDAGLVLTNLNDRVHKVLEYAGLVGHLTIE